MSDSRRAQTVRRLTGAALLALSFGLAIERAGAQQQGSAGANVNVISGTGADGDWTLQRQNEPTMACSSRNPQNCLAGANDYRYGRHSVPDDRREDHRRRLARVVHDQERRTDVAHAAAARLSRRTCPPRVSRRRSRDTRPERIRSFVRARTGCSTTAAWSSAVTRAAAAPSSSRASSTTTIRKVLPASRSPTWARRSSTGSGRPRSWPCAKAAAIAPAARVARRLERDRDKAGRGRQVRAGVEQQGEDQTVDKPWMAVDVPRAGAAMCTSAGPAPACRCRRSPAAACTWRTRSSTDLAKRAAGSCSAARPTAAETWSRAAHPQPRPERRRERRRRGDDCGRHPFAGERRPQLRAAELQSQRRHQQRLHGRRRRPGVRQPRRRPARADAAPPLAGSDARHRPAERRAADRVAAVQRRRAARRDRHGAQRPTAGPRFRPPTVVATLNPFEQGTTDTSFRTNAFPTLAIDGTGRAYLAWSARGYATDGRARRPAMAASSSRPPNGTTWSAPVPVDNQGTPGIRSCRR